MSPIRSESVTQLQKRVTSFTHFGDGYGKPGRRQRKIIRSTAHLFYCALRKIPDVGKAMFILPNNSLLSEENFAFIISS